MHLVTTWFGSFLVDEGAVVEKRLFPRDPEALADRLALVEGWKGLPQGRERMGEPEKRSVMEMAALLRDVDARRRGVEAYVERTATERAPNVYALAGPLLAARLVSLAGGVDALGRLPASTVQLLGAERALFRHLKEHTLPPKHGVLFQHPLVHRAPPWQRGAVARAFAGKIAIAARADAFSRRPIADALRADLQRALVRIRETKRAPAPGRREPPGKRRKRRR